MIMSLFSQALSRTLTVDELFYLKEQFALLEPNKNGTISLDNIRMVRISLSNSPIELYFETWR